jgi:hypothetical protein
MLLIGVLAQWPNRAPRTGGAKDQLASGTDKIANYKK